MPVDRRRLLVLVFTISATSIMGNSLLAPAIPDILDHFGRNDGAAGILVASASIPGVVMAPLVGLLADRFGRRVVLTPCLAAFGVFGLAAATAPSFEILIAARFGMGFGAAGMINLAVVLIGDHWDGTDRTRLIGRNAAVITVGLALMPMIAGFVTDHFGWRWALAPYSLSIVTSWRAWRVLDGSRPASPGSFRQQVGSLTETLRRPVYLTVLVSGIVSFAMIFGVFLTAMPGHLDNEFGLSAQWRGVVLGLPAITSSITGFNVEAVRRRFVTRVVLVVSAAMWATSFLTMGLAPAIGIVVAGSLLYGLGEGVLIPTLQDVAVAEAPEGQRGGAVAAWVGAARLGQTLGPLLAGAVIAVGSTGTMLVVGAALAATLAVGLSLAPLHAATRTTVRT